MSKPITREDVEALQKAIQAPTLEELEAQGFKLMTAEEEAEMVKAMDDAINELSGPTIYQKMRAWLKKRK